MQQSLAMVFLGLLGLMWLGALVLSIGRPRSGLWVLGLALFFSSIGVALDYDRQPLPGWLLPVQTYRSEIYSLIAASLAVPALVALGRRTTHGIAPQTLVLMAIGLYSGLLLGVHEGPSQAGSTVVLTLATMLPMGIFAGMVLRDRTDFLTALRAIALANVVFVGVTLVQFMINPDYALVAAGAVERRFAGPTQNPQSAGLIVGMMTVVVLWLVLNDTRRSLKVVYIALLACNTSLLLWTGSRTGMAMTLIGIAAVLFARAGRAALFLPIIGLAALAAFELIGGLSSDVDVARLTSTQNTRAGAWAELVRIGMQSPLVGVGLRELAVSENSYLYGFAAYGIGMLLLVVLLTLVAGVQCLRLWRRRGALDRTDRALVDLILGFNAMYFASAVAEGHVIGRVSPLIVLMVLFSAMASTVLRLTAPGAWQLEPEPEESDDYAMLEAEPQV